MQLRINTASKEQLKNTWAFAADKYHAGSRPKLNPVWRHLNHCVITACSKEAKALGIQAGMRYEDARTLLPGLRVIVYGRP